MLLFRHARSLHRVFRQTRFQHTNHAVGQGIFLKFNCVHFLSFTQLNLREILSLLLVYL